MNGPLALRLEWSSVPLLVLLRKAKSKKETPRSPMTTADQMLSPVGPSTPRAAENLEMSAFARLACGCRVPVTSELKVTAAGSVWVVRLICFLILFSFPLPPMLLLWVLPFVFHLLFEKQPQLLNAMWLRKGPTFKVYVSPVTTPCHHHSSPFSPRIRLPAGHKGQQP